MASQYSHLAIQEDFEDEEFPSNNSSSSPSNSYSKKNKKTSNVICGWTFWLFLLLLFVVVGGIGFVILKDDPNHNFLSKLSLGEEVDEEMVKPPNHDAKQQQDDSSDYSSSSDSGSNDSNDIGSEDENEENTGAANNNEEEGDDDAVSESLSNSGDDEGEESGANDEYDNNVSNTESTTATNNERPDDGDTTTTTTSESTDEGEGEESSSSEDTPENVDENENNVDGSDGDDASVESISNNEEDGESISNDEEEDVPADDAEEEDLNLGGESGDSSTDGESMEDHTPPEEAGASTISYEEDDDEMEEETIIAALQEKLQPKELHYVVDDGEQSEKLRLHQFLHLHQMKTGGTSMDHYLRCTMDRLKRDKNVTIPYGNIHECSGFRYERCRDDQDPVCKDRLSNASFMSYCAPLKDLNKFRWNTSVDDIRAITVLRNPVDRVWSMFRFQTKSCYQCKNLTDIYDMIDQHPRQTGVFKDLCLKQLMNHETANMLSHSELLPLENAKYQEEPLASSLVKEAVDNMKSFFTAIGLLEELNRTVDQFSAIFPWFQNEVEWSDMTCGITHDNSSPKNNHCGPNSVHWDLPSHPDERTRKAIEEHNKLDIAVYEAAVKHFWRQNDALSLETRR